MLSQIKDKKHIEQNFHSVARVMLRGGTCGCWGGGESKTLAWGFAMAPHRLCALVTFANSLDPDQAQAKSGSGPDLNPNCLTLMVFLKKNVILKKNHEMTKTACKITQ